MENLASSLLSMLIALAFVLVLAWFAIRGLKRLQYGRKGSAGGEVLTFVRALPVGARERVVVVHYRGEEWVLGVTAGGISLLGRGAVPAAPTEAGRAG
jgi:flagellar protein FliO/FliZ